MQLPSIAILGAGSWGSALAVHLASNDQTVHLWEFDQRQVMAMQQSRCNSLYLPGIEFPESIELFSDMDKAVKDVQDILLAVPSHAFRQTLQSLKPFLHSQSRLIWVTKGIDPKSCQLFHNVVEEVIGKRSLAVISGPSFAKEVARGLPTAVSVASNDITFAHDLVKRFNHQAFRIYTCDDLIGVQLGGAVKNVIAIAVGASDGLHYGANARSALITRGLAEITRLGIAMGAQPNTFMGLSGLGDLVLTCTDNQSRNRRFGLAIAQGMDIKTAEESIGQVVEGIYTAHQVMHLANQYKVEMPISEQVSRVIQNKIALKQAVKELLSREPKSE